MSDRLISADALLKKLNNIGWYNNADRDEIAINAVYDAPTVDAETVRHGRWIVSDRFAECSCCGMITTRNELEGISLFGKNEPNYCPNCGARMKEENDL